MSRSSKSIHNFKFAIIGQGLGIFISFIARIFFVKYLGKNYLGINGLFTNILTVLSLAELGIGEAINFSLYKPLATKDEKKCIMLMQFYKKVYIIIGVTILLLGILVLPFLSFIVHDFPKMENIYLIFILFVLNSSVSYFFSYKRNLIIADQNRYIATLYRYGFYFVLNVLQIIFLAITKNYVFFLILQIINTLVENISVSIKANKMYPFLLDKNKINLDKDSKNEITKNTKAMMMHKIGGLVVSSTDNILISTFVDLASVGIYSNYCMIINALNSVFSQLYNSVVASIGNLCAVDEKEKQYDIFKKIDFLGFILYSFSFVCLYNLFNPFIKIWLGDTFLFSNKIVLIICINYYITGMRKANMTFRTASGLFYKDRWKAIIEAFVNLISSVILIKIYGLIGVFLGTFISSVCVCAWVEPYILYKYGFEKKFNNYLYDYLKYLLFTIFVLLQSSFIISLFSFTSLAQLVFNIFICFIVFVINFILIYRNNIYYIFYKDFIKKRLSKNI